MLRPWLLCLSFSILISACSSSEDTTSEEMPVDSQTYQVKKTNSPLTLDGKGSDSNWKQAILLNDFKFPWQDRPAPRTEFRALWDDDFLYFQFDVDDADIVLHEDSTQKLSAVGSDRVELFFSVNDSLSPYYNLEMDPRAWVYSAKGQFYRNGDSSWDWPGLETFASLTKSGYLFEGRIPMKSLTDLELWQNDEKTRLMVGVFRAEFDHLDDGTIKHNWISWIQPDSPKPDFHIPSAFGKWELLP